MKSMEVGGTHMVEKVTPDGRAWLISGNAVRDEAGNVTGGVEVTLEITERKQVEEALRKSEAKHRGLFDTMAQGVVYLNTDGEITSANAAAERILGLSLDEMTRRESLEPRWRVIHEDGSEFAPEAHPSMVALRTGEPVRNVVMGVVNPHEVRHRWILVDAVPEFRPGEERPYRVYAPFADITERRETEIALRKSRQMLQLVLDSIPARVFFRPSGRVFRPWAARRDSTSPVVRPCSTSVRIASAAARISRACQSVCSSGNHGPPCSVRPRCTRAGRLLQQEPGGT